MPRRKSTRKLKCLCVDRIVSCLNSTNTVFHSLPSSCSLYCAKENNPFLCFPSFLLEEIFSSLVELTKVIHLEILQTLCNCRIRIMDLKPLIMNESKFKKLLKSVMPFASNLEKLSFPYGLNKVDPCKRLYQLGEKLTNITYLNLGFFYCEHFLDVIGKNCKVLISLKMYSNLINDEDLKNLCFNTKDPKDVEPRCQNLKNITLEQKIKIVMASPRITAEGIKTLLKYLPQLTSLKWFNLLEVLVDLHRNDYLTTEKVYSLEEMFYFPTDSADLIYDILVKTCPFLTRLSVFNPLGVSNLGKLQKMKHLKMLTIEYGFFEAITFERGIRPLLECVGHSLVELYLEVSEVDFGAIGQFCPQLKILECLLETDVSQLFTTNNNSTSFKNLESVSINFCEVNNLSLNTLKFLFSNCLGLKHLLLWHINNFNYSTLKQILKENPLAELNCLELDNIRNFDCELIKLLISEETLVNLVCISIECIMLNEETGYYVKLIEDLIKKRNLNLKFHINHKIHTTYLDPYNWNNIRLTK